MSRFPAKTLAATLWLILAIFPNKGLAQDGALTQFRLSNGLDVLVEENHSRKAAAIQLWVKVGSAYENESERGISHVIEHMAFKGTERRGVGQIDTEVAEIGGQINAYTSWDETVFHIVVPSSATSRGLDIITDAVFRAVMNPQELEKEKKVVLEEILQDEDLPDEVISKLLFKTAYVKSPYRFPVIGRKEVVEEVTRQNILDFRKKWYVPENMFLIVVGDVDPVAVREDVERLTADVKPTGFLPVSLPQEPPQEQIRSAVVRDPNATEPRLSIAFHIPSMKGYDVNALDLIADLLGGRDDSRLVRILKQDKGLVTSLSVSSVTPKEPGLLIISANLAAENLELATQAIMDELALLAGTPPPPDELEQARIHLESGRVYARETVQGIARNMGDFQNQLGDPNYEQKYLTLNAAVTPRQISAVAKKYLMPPNVSVAVLLPHGEAKDFRIEGLEQIVSRFAAPAITPVAAAETPARPMFRELANGTKVVLVPDNSNPVISFRIASLGGKRFENDDTQGIMNFIARMLTKGAGTMNERDIARKVDNMGGTLQGFSGNDSFGLYASFFSRYWDQALELLAQMYADPTFPQDKLDRERDLIINAIRTEPDNPSEYVIKTLNKTLFPHFPYGFDLLGTPHTVSGFTPEDLKQTFRQLAVPSNTVIAAVGSMDPKEVMDRVERLFGKTTGQALEMPQIPAEHPLESVSETVMRIPRAKAYLTIGFRTVTLTDPDRFALDVLNSILAGQGGRLFLQLRDKESLAYEVTSFFRPGLAPGIFGLYLACDAPKVDRAFAGLVNEIEAIKKTAVGEAELKKAIDSLIGNHLISQQSTSDRAEEVGLHTLYGMGYDYDPVYIARIREVNAADVLRVARRYLDMDHAAIAKILPEGNATNSGSKE
ncbi:MAG: insulinase family protein [Desulfomonile tiedjei]|nr:insulinase family protein [Desulfomonile tiedjei]